MPANVTITNSGFALEIPVTTQAGGNFARRIVTTQSPFNVAPRSVTTQSPFNFEPRHVINTQMPHSYIDDAIRTHFNQYVYGNPVSAQNIYGYAYGTNSSSQRITPSTPMRLNVASATTSTTTSTSVIAASDINLGMETTSRMFSSLKKLSTDLKEMFTSKVNSDVTLEVQEKTFVAHKNILASRSPVFAAMFENNMVENKSGVINIPDCDPEAFNVFLFYLYSAEVDFTKCNIFNLYKITDKYDVPELRLMCVDFMINTLSVENFCETFVLGHQHDEDKLIVEVQNFFNKNFEKIVFDDKWEILLNECGCLANKLLKEMAPKVKM